jgi:hypothetical protein
MHLRNDSHFQTGTIITHWLQAPQNLPDAMKRSATPRLFEPLMEEILVPDAVRHRAASSSSYSFWTG